jgi:PTS system mannose-specific IIA component
MIGIIILAHGKFGQELINVAEKITGPQKNLLALSIDADDSFEKTSENLKKIIKTADEGQGILIFTDLFGGTPSNLALSVLALSTVEVLTGINLPMLIKALSSRTEETQTLDKIVHIVQEAGKKYIQIANDILHHP